MAKHDEAAPAPRPPRRPKKRIAAPTGAATDCAKLARLALEAVRQSNAAALQEVQALREMLAAKEAALQESERAVKDLEAAIQ